MLLELIIILHKMNFRILLYCISFIVLPSFVKPLKKSNAKPSSRYDFKTIVVVLRYFKLNKLKLIIEFKWFEQHRRQFVFLCSRSEEVIVEDNSDFSDSDFPESDYVIVNVPLQDKLESPNKFRNPQTGDNFHF